MVYENNKKHFLEVYLLMDLGEAGQASGTGGCPHTGQGEAEADQHEDARAHYIVTIHR